MNWIEGIGPAGIGKTTFYRKLLSKSSKKSTWITEDQGLADIIRNRKDPGFKKKFLTFYFSQNYINFRKQGYLNSQYLFGNEILELEGKPYNALLMSYVNYLGENDDKIVVDTLPPFLWYVKMIKSLCAFNYYKNEKLVFLDEGILQNHPNLEGVDWDQSVLPKGLIFFHLDPQLNFLRIKKRKREGTTRVIHRELDDQAIKYLIEFHHKEHLERRELLLKLNIPMIDIDLSHDNEIDYQRVDDFLTSCSNTANT